ncbi:MAG: DUF4835 family protein [Salinivirgaceae bacterium]|jgi:hypothetical protein|nr:DUF4835 family protein [Salinivirgaceae bacterium]
MKIFQKKYIIRFLISVTILAYSPLKAQEMDCRIQVNSSQIQGTNKTVFEVLQKALYEFLNDNNWTSHVYGSEERIECSFLLNITKQNSVDDFEGSMQVTSNRPVYGSGYSSPMLNLKDEKIRFRYAEGESLEFSESSHNELTALFVYYLYIVIGFDYDSFSPLGGSEYFTMAEKIVSTAQSSPYTGWKAFESRKNRYWLVENLLNKTYEPIRQYSYTYHRKGLDLMTKNVTEGRTNIAQEIKVLTPVHKQKSNSYLMQMFFEAKADEIIKILKEAPSSEAMRAYNVLKEVNPGNATKYQNIIKKN